jgi:hypothetical protein
MKNSHNFNVFETSHFGAFNRLKPGGVVVQIGAISVCGCHLTVKITLTIIILTEKRASDESGVCYEIEVFR